MIDHELVLELLVRVVAPIELFAVDRHRLLLLLVLR